MRLRASKPWTMPAAPRGRRWLAALARAFVVVALLISSGAAQQLLAFAATGDCCRDEACEADGGGELGVHGCQTCASCSHPSALPAPSSLVPVPAGPPSVQTALPYLGQTLPEHRTPLLRPPAA